MVPDQEEHLCADTALEVEERVHAAFRIRASIDVVAEKDDRVLASGVVTNLREKVQKGREDEEDDRPAKKGGKKKRAPEEDLHVCNGPLI